MFVGAYVNVSQIIFVRYTIFVSWQKISRCTYRCIVAGLCSTKVGGRMPSLPPPNILQVYLSTHRESANAMDVAKLDDF